MNCGQELRDSDPICPRCGGDIERPAPPPEPRWEPPVAPPPGAVQFPAPPLPPPARPKAASSALLIGVCVAVVAAVVLVVTLVPHHSVDATQNDATVPSPVPGASAAPVPPSADGDPWFGNSASAAPSSAAPDPEQNDTAAKTALDDEVQQDEQTATGLLQNWVPQLSSKKLGLRADGIVYDYRSIWRNFQDLKSRYGNVLLVWSSDYSSFQVQGYYVTIADQPYDDGTAANDWCDAEGLDPDDCYAKFLSQTSGPAGTTMIRH